MRSGKNGFEALKGLHEKAQEGLRVAREQEARERAAAEQKREQARRSGASGTPVRDESPAETAAAFERAMRLVKPMQAQPRHVHARRTEETDTAVAQRRASALGEQAKRADGGVSDGGDVTPLLSEGGTAFIRADAAPDTARNLKRGQWPAGAELDLHGLRVEQARHAMLSFIDECLEHNIRCVRVVHGKGYGYQGLEPVLKDKVRSWLVQKAEVMAFSEASEREGGAGALLVLMRQGDGPRR
jgi:DNA-nicking Smr family endonuclease